MKTFILTMLFSITLLITAQSQQITDSTSNLPIRTEQVANLEGYVTDLQVEKLIDKYGAAVYGEAVKFINTHGRHVYEVYIDQIVYSYKMAMSFYLAFAVLTFSIGLLLWRNRRRWYRKHKREDLYNITDDWQHQLYGGMWITGAVLLTFTFILIPSSLVHINNAEYYAIQELLNQFIK